MTDSRAHHTQELLELHKSFVLAALLCGALPAWSAPAAPAAPVVPAQAGPHPIEGSWRWTLPAQKCTEAWNYQSGGLRTSTSGEEVLQSRYEITPMPSLLGFYRISETVTESNGKPDCAGDLHELTGEPVVRFIQFSPRQDQLIVCKAESLKACFGPLKRLTQ
ncbi:MAG: hypothetical protein JWR60_3233 [Polaromonas sp.]|nr:hypothetical protein [Polaromonas sp.]